MTKTVTLLFKHVAPARIDTSMMPLLDLSELPSTILMQTLGKACTMRREHSSYTEAAFVGWLCNRLPVSAIDGVGNIHVDIRKTSEHRTLFTSHTDSVHRGGGENKVRIDGEYWRADKDHALGADDAAGIALMCHMIEADVPGYYIFFRGEECGGVGSSWLAKEMPSLFNLFDRAVAFDRAGYYDVITHQAGERCCSKEFGEALAAQLATDTQWFIPDSTGVFTDTANLMDLVPECTNISVGYKNQHGDREQQHIPFLISLANTVVQVQWDDLPTVRKPMPVSLFSSSFPPKMSTVSTGQGKWEPDLDEDVELLIVALEDAMDNDFEALAWLIAENEDPDDPDAVLKFINTNLLTTDILDACFTLAMDNWPAPQLLSDLYQDCARL